MKTRRTIFKVALVLLLIISIFGCDSNISQPPEVNEVNLMATMGTLPTLYAGLIALSSTDTSYMWYSRDATFAEIDEFPSNVVISENIGTSSGVEDLIGYIEAELAEDQNTFFNLYCDDLRVQFAITLLDEAGVPEENYRVTLLSDGTGSYANFNTRYSATGTYATWEEDLAAWESAKRGETIVENSTYNTTLQNSMFPFAVEYGDSDHKAMYYLQWPEALVSEDSEVSTIVSQSLNSDYGLTKLTPQNILEEMSDDQKLTFQNVVGLGGEHKTTFDGYFLDADKPALIISGTSSAGEYSNDSFEATIQDIVDDYQETYNLFFKPHPRWDPVTSTDAYLEGRQEFLENLDITILPGQMPMEALLFVYPDLKIGGYNSSLYMSVKAEQLAFFIVDDINVLAAPLPYLFNEGYFPSSVNTYPVTR